MKNAISWISMSSQLYEQKITITYNQSNYQ